MSLKKNNGLTLIELLVVLVMSSIIIAGVYRTFIGQQKSFEVQEQVIEMQQNVRGGIHQMVSDIRMAGFGNLSMVLPITVNGKTFNNIVNPDTPVANALTILSSAKNGTTLTSAASTSQNQIVVSTLTDNLGCQLFDTNNKRYISIGGLESHVITSLDAGTMTLTLNGTIRNSHPVGTPVFGIRAIAYQVVVENGVPTLKKDENTGDGSQPEAYNIDNLQFQYLDGNGNPTVNPVEVRIIRLVMTARTDYPDPDYKDGGGYRRRQIASNIHMRNMGIIP